MPPMPPQWAIEAVIGIVGDEDIARLEAVAEALNDHLHGFVEHAHKGGDARARTDQPPCGVGHTRPDIEHFVDGGAHGCFAQYGEHLISRIVEACLDDR